HCLKYDAELLENSIQGGTMSHITKETMERRLCPFVDNLDLQKNIADILSAADKEIDLLEQELAQQEQKKKSLMQLLLTGIVRV
ncbi:MAG: restriction endonuclease subunit S, partial [Lentisphaeria bacterium]|nr:restriction endonuclease subunit S [Lentisphaeria bacterium]